MFECTPCLPQRRTNLIDIHILLVLELLYLILLTQRGSNVMIYIFYHITALKKRHEM